MYLVKQKSTQEMFAMKQINLEYILKNNRFDAIEMEQKCLGLSDNKHLVTGFYSI